MSRDYIKISVSVRLCTKGKNNYIKDSTRWLAETKGGFKIKQKSKITVSQ